MSDAPAVAPARRPAAPEFRVDGQLALVTGASRGIGHASALALARAGARVIALSRSEGELDRLVAQIDGECGQALALPCDITSRSQVREALARVPEVDILVNSAGGNRPQPFLDVTEDVLEQLWQLNVKGTFLVAQCVAREMVVRGRGGVIVNVSSQMGHVGAADRTVYCATKHAVEGLTKAMAIELAPHRIRVNAIAPTFVETPMTAPFFEDPGFRAHVEQQIPLGRIGTVADVAAAVLFAASPASGLMTGSSLRIDGGWTAQ
jgi:NAD(P)-dependent dehydrogenase (short-subunit alcohol dehydrogenase family)